MQALKKFWIEEALGSILAPRIVEKNHPDLIIFEVLLRDEIRDFLKRRASCVQSCQQWLTIRQRNKYIYVDIYKYTRISKIPDEANTCHAKCQGPKIIGF